MLHHRRTQPHSGHLGDKRALVLPGKVRHVRRSAAHVEGDDLVEAGELRHLHRADDPARRAGENGILPLEPMRVGEPARRLHELQTHAGKLRFNALHVAAQDRRQIGVNDRGVAAGDELHQRTHLVASRYVRKSDLPCKRGKLAFMLRVAIRMHKHDGAGANAIGVGSGEVALCALQIERPHWLTVRADAFLDLHHAFVDWRRQDDTSNKKLGPVLVADAKRIAEAARDGEHGALAFALEQRIGGNGGAHLDHFHLCRRDRCARGEAEYVADALNRRIQVALRIFGQQLVRGQRAVRTARDNIGESPPAVDPELPATRSGVCHHRIVRRLGLSRCGRAREPSAARSHYSESVRLASAPIAARW